MTLVTPSMGASVWAREATRFPSSERKAVWAWRRWASRNAGVRDPWLPTGAKFQLLGPRKERAPLVQREDSGGTESQSSPRSWSPSFQQFASGEIAK